MISENGEMINIVKMARNGNIKAKQFLLENSYHLIVECATKTYNILNEEFRNIYPKGIPNSLLDLDDIISDFSERAIKIENVYLNGDSKIYFSNFLYMEINTYINKYLFRTRRKIKEKLRNENILSIHHDSEIFMALQDQMLVEEIKKFVKLDKRLNYFDDFLYLIINGYSYQELTIITGLDKRRLNMKIKYFAKIYNEIKEEYDSINNLKSDEVTNIILQGNIYSIKYYQKIIDKFIKSIFNKTDINDEQIQKLLSDINIILKHYLKENRYNFNNFNIYLDKLLDRYKYMLTKGEKNGKKKTKKC